MAKKSTAKKPKAQALPGMEDRAIPALEDAGAEYADIRDQRIALNQQEVALKKRVRQLMHKHEKQFLRLGEPGDPVVAA